MCGRRSNAAQRKNAMRRREQALQREVSQSLSFHPPIASHHGFHHRLHWSLTTKNLCRSLAIFHSFSSPPFILCVADPDAAGGASEAAGASGACVGPIGARYVPAPPRRHPRPARDAQRLPRHLQHCHAAQEVSRATTRWRYVTLHSGVGD